MLDRLDFWITLFTLAAAIYFLGWKDIVEPRVRPIVRWIQQRRRATPLLADEPEPRRSDAIPLLNATEPQMNGSVNPAELALNAAEVQALQRMIAHNKTAAKPSKSSTIQAGFGVSRGGSPTYVRASLIYDALFGPVAPAVRYRERTPEQEAAREALGMNKA